MENAKKYRNITKRKDGRYMGRFCYKGESFTVYGTSVSKVAKELADLRYEVEHGTKTKRNKFTLNQWFEIWITDCKSGNCKYGTIQNYRNIYKLYIGPTLGKTLISEIRTDQIQRLYNNLLKKGIGCSTIGLVGIVLSGMLKQAYKTRLIVVNPAEYAIVPKEKRYQKKQVKVLSCEEQKIFLQYAKEYSPYYNVYAAMLGLGLRVGEARALIWEDVGEHEVFVRATLKYHKGVGYVRDLPKTETSERIIPLLPEVAAVFENQKERQQKQKLEAGEYWKPQEGLENLVFTTSYKRIALGTPISNDALNVDLKKLVAIIKVDHEEFPDRVTPHMLRHSFCTRGLEKGVDVKVMSKLMGHKSLAMTTDLYSHVLPDFKVQEMKKIEGILG